MNVRNWDGNWVESIVCTTRTQCRINLNENTELNRTERREERNEGMKRKEKNIGEFVCLVPARISEFDINWPWSCSDEFRDLLQRNTVSAVAYYSIPYACNCKIFGQRLEDQVRLAGRLSEICIQNSISNVSTECTHNLQLPLRSRQSLAMGWKPSRSIIETIE